MRHIKTLTSEIDLTIITEKKNAMSKDQVKIKRNPKVDKCDKYLSKVAELMLVVVSIFLYI